MVAPPPILTLDHPVTLVGGGPMPERCLAAALAMAPTVIAADGGANHDLPGGHAYTAVIGDMDSARAVEIRARQGARLHPVAEQDTTDLEKCLYSVAAPLYLGFGFLGGRLDHELAAMNALARYPDKRVVLVGSEDVCFLCPATLELDLPPDTRVSLFPMAPARGTVSDGLRWPVTGLDLRPGGRIGTSNRALGGTVRVGFDAPAVVVILPQARFDTAVAALSRSR